MSKNNKKITENTEIVIDYLMAAFDHIEGEYSNIPVCCIYNFVNGRTYKNFWETLSKKDQNKLDAWGYVPCGECFKKNKKNKIKKNGTSPYGKMIFAMVESLRGE